MIKSFFFLLKNNSPGYTIRYTAKRVLDLFELPVKYQVPEGLNGKEIFLGCREIFQTFDSKKTPRNLNTDVILTYAEQILQGRIDILGYKGQRFGKPYEWQKDFTTSGMWDADVKYHKNTKMYEIKGDVKVPWELSRSFQLVTLGQAYALTGEDRYVREFCAEIDDWILNNPVEMGINWRCTMEVAIRAVNWIIAANFFLDCKSISDEFWNRLAESLYVHMIFCRHHCEYGVINCNHLVADICGLVFLGLLFEKTTYGKRVFKFALREFKREIFNQVHKDGTDYEGSVCYHYLVTQLFFYTTVFLTRAGQRLPQAYLERLEKMLEFINAYIKPNGHAPVIGDCDDGRFIKYLQSAPTDHRHLLALGAVFFSRPDFKKTAGDVVDDIIWLYGLEGVNKYYDLNGEQQTEREINQAYAEGAALLVNEEAIELKSATKGNLPVTSRQFPDSGYYILKEKDIYLFTKAGDIGLRGRGGHGHCDQLGFELCVKGQEVFVDPGTYIYTGNREMRNLFRSTSYHNTVMIDKEEQNRMDSKNVFMMKHDTQTEVLECTLGAELDRVVARHYGYHERLGVVHTRQFELDKVIRCLSIVDSFEGAGTHRLEWYFHLGENCVMLHSLERNTVGFSTCEMELDFSDDAEFEILDGYLSKSYGQKVPAKILHLSVQAELSTKHKFTIKIWY